MTMDEVIRYTEFIARVLAILGLTIEFTPIKLSPLRWIGNRLNKATNERIDKIQKQVDRIEADNAKRKYDEDMTDLRNIKSRIHSYGILISKGELLPYETLKSALDDLDVYDFYKDKYGYMEVNGKKVKINGEVKVDKTLIEGQMSNYSQR